MSTDTPSPPFTSMVFPRISGRNAELDREFESARVRGYSAGHAAGMRVAAESAAVVREELRLEREQERVRTQRRLGQALVALDAALSALAEREHELALTGQRDLERMAIELAEAILVRELRDDTRAALRRTMAHVDPAEVRELRLHPADVETLADAAPAGVALIADHTLAPGDAIAVLEEGRVDARISAALERARRALLGDDGDPLRGSERPR